MKQPKTVSGLFQRHQHIFNILINILMRLSSLKLFQAISVFCFRFISECATALRMILTPKVDCISGRAIYLQLLVFSLFITDTAWVNNMHVQYANIGQTQVTSAVVNTTTSFSAMFYKCK